MYHAVEDHHRVANMHNAGVLLPDGRFQTPAPSTYGNSTLRAAHDGAAGRLVVSVIILASIGYNYFFLDSLSLRYFYRPVLMQ